MPACPVLRPLVAFRSGSAGTRLVDCVTAREKKPAACQPASRSCVPLGCRSGGKFPLMDASFQSYVPGPTRLTLITVRPDFTLHLQCGGRKDEGDAEIFHLSDIFLDPSGPQKKSNHFLPRFTSSRLSVAEVPAPGTRVRSRRNPHGKPPESLDWATPPWPGPGSDVKS